MFLCLCASERISRCFEWFEPKKGNAAVYNPRSNFYPSPTLWDFTGSANLDRSQIKPLETAKPSTRSYICKFAILLDWKIQLHLSKATWALKRFMLYNIDIWLEIVGTIWNSAESSYFSCAQEKMCTQNHVFARVKSSSVSVSRDLWSERIKRLGTRLGKYLNSAAKTQECHEATPGEIDCEPIHQISSNRSQILHILMETRTVSRHFSESSTGNIWRRGWMC
jgi:hypothetical protein